MLEGFLTPRRRAALDALRRAGGDGRPVHYSDVAAQLGVSAWTAYTLLRELERAGAAARSYSVPRGSAGGRSRILFRAAAPEAPALDLAPLLQAAYDRFAAIGDEGAAVRAYLAEASGDVAVHIGFWLARLQAAGAGASDAARGLLEGGQLPAAKLQALSALGLGSTLGRLRPARLAVRLAAANSSLADLLDEAARASDARLAAIVDAARRLDRGTTTRRIAPG